MTNLKPIDEDPFAEVYLETSAQIEELWIKGLDDWAERNMPQTVKKIEAKNVELNEIWKSADGKDDFTQELRRFRARCVTLRRLWAEAAKAMKELQTEFK